MEEELEQRDIGIPVVLLYMSIYIYEYIYINIYICAMGKPWHGPGIAAQMDSLMPIMRPMLTSPP